jgi:hypothetical protein
MNIPTNWRLAEITPEQIAALKRAAHLERSQVARALLRGAFGWLAGLVREAGQAARLSEAPRPYGGPSTRACG